MAYGVDNTFIAGITSATAPNQKPNVGYILGRVVHIIYGPDFYGTNTPDPNYQDSTDLGKILFQSLSGTQSSTSNSAGNQLAKPLYSWMKQYPLQGEYVYILSGPGLGLNESTEESEFYYLPPFNLWGSNHHNALPNLINYGDYVQKIKRSYQGNQATNQPSNLTTGSIEYPLGDGFFEKGDVKTLKMFVGDVAFEGRYGASVRFGSSLAANKDQNFWYKGPEGNPITILRNGQGRQIDQEGWIPTVEDINRDASSIYLTNGQIIVIDDIQNNFSLTSLETSLENTITVAIPLNQQLISMDSLSPNAQDERINESNPSVSTTPSTINTAPTETVSNIQPAIEAITVVGDYQDVFGTFVVSLRAVNSTGAIVASVSATGEKLNSTYEDAVSQLKTRIPNQTLKVPSVSKLTKG